MIRQSPLSAILFLFVLFTGCASSSTMLEEPSSSSSELSLAELEKAFWARQDSAKTVFTQADADFMTGMIGHHAQALIMAGFAPTHGASSEVKLLCSRIINAQKDEIATMQNWLRDRNQAVPEVHIEGSVLMIHGVDEEHHHMPGMLSPEQLQELDDARGADFDRLFLTYMIQHHEGAVDMVGVLFDTDGAALDDLAFKLASDIQVDQLTEIARMERMLSILTASDQ